MYAAVRGLSIEGPQRQVRSQPPQVRRPGQVCRRQKRARRSGSRTPRSHASSESQPPRRAASQAGTGGTSVRHGSMVEGTVSANRAGYGFLKVDGFKESVFLPPPEMRGVMHGDRLRVKVARRMQRIAGPARSSKCSSAASPPSSARLRCRAATPGSMPRTAGCSCAARWRLTTCTAPARATGSLRRSRGTQVPRPRRRRVIEKRLDPERPVELATESAIARFGLPERVLRHGTARGARLRRAGGSEGVGRAGRPARPAAGHDRRRGCARLRRCASTPSRTRTASADRRDRRCQPLRAPGHCAR